MVQYENKKLKIFKVADQIKKKIVGKRGQFCIANTLSYNDE